MVSEQATCARCGAALLAREGYWIQAGPIQERRCRRHAFLDRGLLLRSILVALLVGTLLILINQAGWIFGPKSAPPTLWWQLPLTYSVPFLVSMYGALSNARIKE